jgi:hypothetical protein
MKKACARHFLEAAENSERRERRHLAPSTAKRALELR